MSSNSTGLTFPQDTNFSMQDTRSATFPTPRVVGEPRAVVTLRATADEIRLQRLLLRCRERRGIAAGVSIQSVRLDAERALDTMRRLMESAAWLVRWLWRPHRFIPPLPALRVVFKGMAVEFVEQIGPGELAQTRAGVRPDRLRVRTAPRLRRRRRAPMATRP